MNPCQDDVSRHEQLAAFPKARKPRAKGKAKDKAKGKKDKAKKGHGKKSAKVRSQGKCTGKTGGFQGFQRGSKTVKASFARCPKSEPAKS